MQYIIMSLIGFLGFEMGLKLSLLYQLTIVVVAILWMHYKTKADGLEGIIYLVIFLMLVGGIVVGDLYYYNAFNDNRNGSDFIHWMTHP